MKKEYNAGHKKDIDNEVISQKSTHECPISEPEKADKELFRTMTKVCNVCKVDKPVTEFYFKKTQNTYYYNCKECGKKEQRKYNKDKKSEISVSKKQYYVENAELIKKRKKTHNIDKERRDEKFRERYKTDINFRILQLLRGTIRRAIKSKKSDRTIKYLGCSIEHFKNYIASKFLSGMSWENHGKWHLDHIYPVSLVDVNNEEQIRKVFHYSNYQPLWAAENIRKSNKIES